MYVGSRKLLLLQVATSVLHYATRKPVTNIDLLRKTERFLFQHCFPCFHVRKSGGGSKARIYKGENGFNHFSVNKRTMWKKQMSMHFLFHFC